MPATAHSSSSEECFNWLKAVRETMCSKSEKDSYRRKLWLWSVSPIHNLPSCCFRSRASEQSSITAPRMDSSPPARSRVSALTSMQPPAAPAVERRVSRIQAGGESVKKKYRKAAMSSFSARLSQMQLHHERDQIVRTMRSNETQIRHGLWTVQYISVREQEPCGIQRARAQCPGASTTIFLSTPPARACSESQSAHQPCLLFLQRAVPHPPCRLYSHHPPGRGV